jgi:hypothetical protein
MTPATAGSKGGGIGAATIVGGAREPDSLLKRPLQVKKPNLIRGTPDAKSMQAQKHRVERFPPRDI